MRKARLPTYPPARVSPMVAEVYIYARHSDVDKLVVVDRVIDDRRPKPYERPLNNQALEHIAMSALRWCHGDLWPFVALYFHNIGHNVGEDATSLLSRLGPLRIEKRERLLVVIATGKEFPLHPPRNPHYITVDNRMDRVPSSVSLSEKEGYENAPLSLVDAGVIRSHYFDHLKTMGIMFGNAAKAPGPMYTEPFGVVTPAPRSDISSDVEEISQITKMRFSKLLE